MGKYHDYISSLGAGEDGGTIYPETFMDDLNGAYDADFQGATAQIALLTEQVASLEAEKMQLAAANWTLLQSIPSNTDVADNAPGEDNDGDGDDEDDDPDSEDFFKKESN